MTSSTEPKSAGARVLLRWFKEWWLVLLAVGFLSWRLFYSSPGALAGKTPDFTLPRIGGGDLTLSATAGHVRIIDFWATWCGPCQMMTPIYVDLYNRFHAQGLDIVGVALDNQDAVSRFVSAHQIPYPILLGDAPTVREFGGIRGIPTAFVLDRQGRVVQKHVGYRPEFLLEHDIEPLLKTS